MDTEEKRYPSDLTEAEWAILEGSVAKNLTSLAKGLGEPWVRKG
jgi:hypothetical protein